jgi:hypothetical protein
MTVHSELQKNFLTAVFQIDSNNPFDMSFDGQRLDCKDMLLYKMTERLLRGETAVLPFLMKKEKVMMLLVLNPNERQLQLHAAELEKFLIPVWAEPFSHGVKPFFSDRKPLGLLGAKLFPAGYVCFSSPVRLRDEVFQVLNTWLQLDHQRPRELSEETEMDAYSLRRQFHEAISIKNYEEAGMALKMLRQGNLLSDENNSFLEIQFLSTQGKWQAIWESNNYDAIANLDPLPAMVREALLKSFYQCVIMPAEKTGATDAALRALSDYQNSLGTLLRYRSGLEGDLFMRLFAYQAVLTENYEALERLVAECREDETLNLLASLMKQVPKKVGEKGQETPFELAKRYFADRLYDETFICLLDAPASLLRTQLLLGVATMTEDKEVLKTAREAFRLLPEEEQQAVWHEPQAKGWAKYVLGQSWRDEVGQDIILPNTWDEWFQVLLDDRDYLNETHKLDLTFSLDSKRGYWDSSSIALTTDVLMELLVNDHLSSAQTKGLRIMLPSFAGFMLRDDNFPDTEAEELYEYTVAAIQLFCSRNQTNTALQLNLLAGLFQIDFDHCQSQWAGMHKWLNSVPSLKLAGEVLEALELFCDYGLTADQLLVIYNNWVATLTRQFGNEMRTQVDTWRRLGMSLGADFSLIERLDALLAQSPPRDPLTRLSKTSVAVFSCREKAATRAASRIMERNSDIKVTVCSADRMNDHVKACASNCDLAIIVTACTSHALTYGITPYLQKNPVFPRSSGETGIIEAFEEWAATV